MTGEGLASIDLDSSAVDDWGEELTTSLLEGVDISLATADVADAFHRLRVPLWLRRYFGMPPGTAKEFNLVGKVVDGRVLGPEALGS